MTKQPTFHATSAKWGLRKECRNSILITRHYPDLGSASDWLNQISQAAQQIRRTNQIWVVTRHQYGISVLVSQTSFRGRRVKCRLFSQAKKKRGPNLFHLRPGLHAAATKSDFFVCVVKNRVWRFFAFNRCDFSQFFVLLIITEVQSELAIITKFAKIGKNRKSDDFLCYLPFCTVLCHVNNH